MLPNENEEDGPSCIVGRERELQQLRMLCARLSSSHQRGPSQIVFITGPAGSGKSILARCVDEMITSQGGFFLEVSCSPTQGGMEPLAPIHHLVADLVEKTQQRGSAHVKRLKESVQEATGGDIQLLTNLVQPLSYLFQADRVGQELGRRRNPGIAEIHFAYGELMKFMATKDFPIGVLIDNFHLLDSASVGLLSALLIRWQIPSLLVVACCPDGNLRSGEDQLSTMHKNLSDHAIIPTEIYLGHLSKPYLFKLLASKVNRTPSACEDLCELIYDRGHGDTLASVQFLRYLKHESMVVKDGENWIWDIDAIEERLEDRSVNATLTKFFGDVPNQCVEATLKVASCTGLDIDLDILFVGVPYPRAEVEAALQTLEEKRLIARNGFHGYRWCQDSLREAAYDLIPPSQRNGFHVDLGKKLLAGLPKVVLDNKAFSVLHHCSFSLDEFRSSSEKIHFAVLCLTGGVKAARAAAFDIALSHLWNGIDVMGDSGWSQSYDLSLALFNAAAEMSFSTGKVDATEYFLSEILIHARCFSDKQRAFETKINFLGTQERFQESIELGLKVLDELGAPLQKNHSFLALVVAVYSTRRLLTRKGIVDFLVLPKLRDESTIAAFRVIHMMFPAVYRTDPTFGVFLIVKGLRLTLERGISPVASTLLGMFGAMLCYPLGHVDEGAKLADLGWSILEEYQANELKCRMCVLLYGFTRPWVVPFASCITPLSRATRFGEATGDIEMVAMTLFLRSCFELFAGKPLDQVVYNMGIGERRIRELHQIAPLAYHTALHQTALNLSTESSNPLVLSGDIMDEVKSLQDHKATGHDVATAVMLTCKAFLAVHLCQYEEAYRITRQLRKYKTDSFTPVLVFQVAFLDAFSEIVTSRSTTCLKRLANPGKWGIVQLRKWNKHCSSNVGGMLALLEAESFIARGEHRKAQERFQYSIRLSSENGHLHEQALAWERACIHCQVHLGDIPEARAKFSRAQTLYTGWGAATKVQQMRLPQNGN